MELLAGIDLAALITTVGYAGLFAIVFAESGLLIGFFLPGDSLLFTAGFLASQGYLSIGLLVIGCFAAAVLGDNFGYAFGRRLGPRVFRREDSLFFHRDHLERSRRFYERHGGKTLILARFLPVVRTFAPILAGVGGMRYAVFFAYNVAGAFLWAVGLTVLGYWLGNAIPDVDRYLIPIILVIVMASMLPTAFHVLKDPGHRAAVAKFVRMRLDRHPAAKKAIGIALVAFGFVALLLPFVPFAWVGFVGLELLGLRVLLREKIRAWRSRQT